MNRQITGFINAALLIIFIVSFAAFIVHMEEQKEAQEKIDGVQYSIENTKYNQLQVANPKVVGLTDDGKEIKCIQLIPPNLLTSDPKYLDHKFDHFIYLVSSSNLDNLITMNHLEKVGKHVKMSTEIGAK